MRRPAIARVRKAAETLNAVLAKPAACPPDCTYCERRLRTIAAYFGFSLREAQS